MKKLTLGSILITISLFMLLGFFNTKNPMTLSVGILTFIVTVLIPAFGGSALFYSHFKSKQKLLDKEHQSEAKALQSQIIKLAEMKNGKVTIVEIMGELGIKKRQTKNLMSLLIEQGIAEIEITHSGVLVYSFYDLINIHEKESSKGILDA